jgi:hypothetical protein
LQWLRRCFEPCTREKAEGKIRLLICDGHGSHVTPEFIIHCMFYSIVLLVLPPHTSHISQPLDVGVFKLLKTYLSGALHGLISSEISRLQKWEWLDKYVTARKQAMSESNILSAFSTAGLFPFYPPKVLRRIPSLIESETLVDRTTPEPSISPLEHPLLTSSPSDMNVFQAANEFLKDSIAANPTISPVERQHINRLTRSSEKFFTRSNLRAEENTALREIINARKNWMAGIRGFLKDKRCLTKSEIFVEMARSKRAAEEKAAAAKARKRKTKLNQVALPDPSIDPSLSHPDLDVLDPEDEVW